MIEGFLILLTSVIVGVVAFKPPHFYLPPNTTTTKWNQTNLTKDFLFQELSNQKCYSSERNFLACAAAVDQMAYFLGIKYNQKLVPIRSPQEEDLNQPDRLAPWLQAYHNPAWPKINFTKFIDDNFFNHLPKKYHKFIIAMGYNGWLSINQDPHSYLKPNLDDDDDDLDEDVTSSPLPSPDLSPEPEIPSRPAPLLKFKRVVYLSLANNPEVFSLITIKQFSTGSCQQFQEALQKVINQHSQKLIIDLKQNPGGLTDEAVCIASLFLGKKEIVTFKHLSGKIEHVSGPRDAVYFGQLQIFLDEQSASAAELLAGSLQNYHRAQIMGDISYGKGTFQIADRSFWNKYKVIIMRTQGYFFFPNGQSPQMKGIIPDQRIEQKQGNREQDLFLFPLPKNSLKK